jgi:mRNA interferase RelE/StbE
MSKYAITFARSARKELEALDEKIINNIFPKIENLSIEPRPSGCRKLTGNKHLWRIRAGNFRIIYSIDDNKNLVDIIAVRDRKDAYR